MVLCHKNIPKQHHSHYGEKYISHVYHQLVDPIAPFRAAGFPPLLFQLQEPRLLSPQLCAGRTDAGLQLQTALKKNFPRRFGTQGSEQKWLLSYNPPHPIPRRFSILLSILNELQYSFFGGVPFQKLPIK